LTTTTMTMTMRPDNTPCHAPTHKSRQALYATTRRHPRSHRAEVQAMLVTKVEEVMAVPRWPRGPHVRRTLDFGAVESTLRRPLAPPVFVPKPAPPLRLPLPNWRCGGKRATAGAKEARMQARRHHLSMAQNRTGPALRQTAARPSSLRAFLLDLCQHKSTVLAPPSRSGAVGGPRHTDPSHRAELRPQRCPLKPSRQVKRRLRRLEATRSLQNQAPRRMKAHSSRHEWILANSP